MALSTDNSVLAKALGGESYEEYEALEALEPGQGAVLGNGGLNAAGADSPTKRIVREPRNPGGLNVDNDTGPLAVTYAVGNNVETVGFPPHAQARCLLAFADAQGTAGTDDTYTQGTDLGWNADGYLESTAGAGATEPVAFIAQEESVTMASTDGPTHVLVEFY